MRAVVYTRRAATPPCSTWSSGTPPSPAPARSGCGSSRAGVNPTDWKFRAGGMGELAFPEIVPGQDGAGVVDAVGPGVTELAVGDRVWTMLAQHTRPGGTAQEQVVLPVEQRHRPARPRVVRRGRGARRARRHRAPRADHLRGRARPARPGRLAGRTVLVAGGAGAVGNAAIQLARWAGATVISTVSSAEKAALATAAGAQHTVNYREGDPVAAIRALAPDGVDIVVEVAPAQNLRLDLQVIRPRATIAIYANNGGDEVTLSVRETFSTNARFQWVLLYTVGQAGPARGGRGHHRRPRRRRLRHRRGARPPVHHYPLEQTAAAHAAVEDGVVGKVLLDVADGLSGPPAVASHPPRSWGRSGRRSGGRTDQIVPNYPGIAH